MSEAFRVAALVEQGSLGRKTGRGCYVHDKAGNRPGKADD